MFNTTSLSFCAASCASMSNLFYRRSSTVDRSANTFLFFYYLVSFLCVLVMDFGKFSLSWSPVILAIGGFAGLLNVGLMLLISGALKSGPSGLTYAFQNASSIFPNVLLYLIFGESFGFVITPLQLVGMSLILLGLFMASSFKQSDIKEMSTKWIWYVLASLVVQVFILSIFQWRCLLFAESSHVLIPCTVSEEGDVWFMPAFFGAGLCLQFFRCFVKRESIEAAKVVYGSLSGVANAFSTYLLLVATKWALPIDKGIIFPLFAVSVIILCNIWGYKIYRERVHIGALFLCVIGILVATILDR